MASKSTPSPLQLRCFKIDVGATTALWWLCDQDVSSQDCAVLVVVDFQGRSTTSSVTGSRMSSSCGKKCGPKRGPF